MVITSTSIAFTLLFVGLSICSFWFFQAFRRSTENQQSSYIGLVISVFIFLSALQNGILGFGSLLFSGSQVGLFYVLLLTNVALVLHATLGVYSVYYIFFPRFPFHFGPIATGLLGFLLILVTLIFAPRGVITPEGGLYWDISYRVSLLTFLLLAASIGSFIYIFSQLAQKGKTREVKILSRFLVVGGLLGFFDVFLRFVLLYSESRGDHLYGLDLIIGVVGLIFLAFLSSPIILKPFLVDSSRI